MKKICVIGVGNPLRRDDGVGLVLLDKLIIKKNELPKGLEFFDGGTGGLNIIHIFPDFNTVVFLDAVNFNGKTGESRLIKIDDIKRKNDTYFSSTHSIDILKAVEISEKMGEKPENIFIFAVQPSDVSFGNSITEELSGKIDSIFENLIKNLNKIVT